jgi:NAD(P)-dependent dehydrogenase (short-subunit alcohol dehydrogenase family)
MRLESQVALISGAGRGIGKAIALALAREGADIGFAELNRKWAEQTAAEITQLGRKAHYQIADVSDYDQVQDWIDAAAQHFGRIDIMVNNAGIAKGQPFLEITRENWENHLKVHLFGTFYCSQAAAKQMAKRNYGRIVSIASVAGLMGPIDIAPYGAAKAGIIGLTRAMALELADYGITANVIAPARSILSCCAAPGRKRRTRNGRTIFRCAGWPKSRRSPARRHSWPTPSHHISLALSWSWTAAP